LRRDQRSLLGRLRQHGVAGGQSGRNLTHENRQREIPRADTDDRTERTMRIVRELGADLRRVITQEVDRFADFRHGIRQRLARFAHHQTHQRMHLRFEQIGRTCEAIGARFDRRRLPDRCGGHRMRQRRAHVFRSGFDNRADEVTMVGRIAHVARGAHGDFVVFEHRSSTPRVMRTRQQR
jgi:hypothetical protein